MIKTVKVVVDSASWPTGSFPPRNLKSRGASTLNVLEIALWIGCVSLPPRQAGVGLNAWWAWLKYCCAFSPVSKLRLRVEYNELDPHQKTIVSDDLGMGLALAHLTPILGLQSIIEGRYFAETMAPTLGAKIGKKAKNGSFKSPDFVGLDGNGRWHVIECKGTQSSQATRSGQIATGTLQKANLIFPPAFQGEKIVSALLIGTQGGAFESELRIVDPEGDLAIEVTESNAATANEALIRGTIARALAAAGFVAAAAIVAAPEGSKPFDRPTKGQAEDDRLAALNEKLKRANLELTSSLTEEVAHDPATAQLGMRLTQPLAFPVEVDGTAYNFVEAVLEVPIALLETVRGIVQDRKENTLAAFSNYQTFGLNMQSSGTSSTLKIGNIFFGKLTLHEDAPD